MKGITQDAADGETERGGIELAYLERIVRDSFDSLRSPGELFREIGDFFGWIRNRGEAANL